MQSYETLTLELIPGVTPRDKYLFLQELLERVALTAKSVTKTKYGVFINGKCQFITSPIEERADNAERGLNNPVDVFNRLKELYRNEEGVKIMTFTETVITHKTKEIEL